MVKVVETAQEEDVPAPKGPASASAPRPGSPRVVKTDFDLDSIVDKAAKAYNLDPLLIRAIIQQESSGNPAARSSAGALGLMQLMPGTAKDMGVTDPLDPEQNVLGGAKYFRQLVNRNNGDVGMALLHYVGGRDPTKWGAQSFAYPHLVLEHYRKLGGRQMDPQIPRADWATKLASGVSIPNPIGMIPGSPATAFPTGLDVINRLQNGRGPDLSQGLSGPDANLPVGEKFARWWRAEGPGDRAVERGRKSIANAGDEDPLGLLGWQLPGMLATGAITGNMLNGIISNGVGAIPKVGPSAANFLLGNAGWGAAGTREGSSAALRLASAAAQGGVQGALSGWQNASPKLDGDVWNDVQTGAMLGAGLGAGGHALGQVISAGLFGPRINPKVAELGLEAIDPKMPGRPAGAPVIPLKAAPNSQNNLAVDPAGFVRKTAEIIGEPGPIAGPTALNAVRQRIGGKIDEAGQSLYVAADGALLGELDAIAQTLRAKNVPDTVMKRLWAEIGADAVSTGITDGKRLVELTATGGPLHRMVNSSNPVIREAGLDATRALFSAAERGARVQLQHAVAAGDEALALQIQTALEKLKKARGDWRDLKTLEEVLDPTTGQFAPKDLRKAVERHSDNIYPEVPMAWASRVGQNFDPSISKYGNWLSNVPYSALAALTSVAAQMPVTTGQAALLAGAGLAAGAGSRYAAGKVPGYPTALLRRSARTAVSPLEQVMQQTAVPLMTKSGLQYATPN